MTEYISNLAQIISVQPYPLLFATVSGSQLYGFPSAKRGGFTKSLI
jgi:hypothetical protein